MVVNVCVCIQSKVNTRYCYDYTREGRGRESGDKKEWYKKVKLLDALIVRLKKKKKS